MSDYDNTNTFVLFINDRKGDDDGAPDRTGTLNVGGVEYFMDGWIKEGKKGKFLSGRIKPKNKGSKATAKTGPTTSDIDTPPF